MVTLGAVVGLSPVLVQAQARPGTPPTQAPQVRPGDEIRLDESTSLKAAALEARMSALIANFALLQRQAQDMQQEMQKMLDERKGLIEGAGRRMNVDTRDPNEWVLDTKGQRYVRQQRPAPGAQAPQR
jgi:hypothetical protein